MPLDTIQTKLYKGYGKIAKKLGRTFEVFRAELTSDPLTDINLLLETKAAFSQDIKFSKPHDEGLSIWYCWIDGTFDVLFDIQQGDYLKSADTGETFLIASTQEFLPIRAIKINGTITVTDGEGYSDTGSGFGPAETDVVTNVPCYIEESGSSSSSSGYAPSSELSGFDTRWSIYLHDPEKAIKANHIVVDGDGNRGQVKRVYRSDIGTRLIVEES